MIMFMCKCNNNCVQFVWCEISIILGAVHFNSKVPHNHSLHLNLMLFFCFTAHVLVHDLLHLPNVFFFC